MAHPRRDRPYGYFLIEHCAKQPITPLFRDALQKGRGQVHRGWLPNFDDEPYSIFLSNEPEFVGSWIRVGNAGFNLSFDLFQRWRNERGWMKPNPNFGGRAWQVPSYQAYAVGLDGKRHSYLLMTPTRLIGCAGDLEAVYSKANRLSKKQGRTSRRHQLIKQILPWVSDAWLAENDGWVPRDHEKPKNWKSVHWNQVVGELVTGRRQRKHEYVPPPPPPPRMGRGKRPWHRRRWQRRPDRDEVLAQLHDIGHDDLAAMEQAGYRIFRPRGG